MRIVVALIVNLLLLVRALLGLPFRWMRTRRRPAYVRFALRGDPPYRELIRRRWRMFSRRDPAEVISLAALGEQLALLAKDPRVRGAVLCVDHLQISPVKADAIAASLAKFRAAGKEVVGYALHAGNVEYEVLCAADRIVLSPAGRLDLTGFAAGATAMGSALERLGISAQFVRRGDYKTAPELFTDAEISDIHRRTLEHLLDLRLYALLSRIARGRRLTIEQARRTVDAGPYSAKRARAAGLCDALCHEADLGSFLDAAAPGNGAAVAASAAKAPGTEGAQPTAAEAPAPDTLTPRRRADASATNATLSDRSAPDPSASDASAPRRGADASAPNATLSDRSALDASAPDASAPRRGADASAPNATLSDRSAPHASASDASTARRGVDASALNATLSDRSAPDASASDASASDRSARDASALSSAAGARAAGRPSSSVGARIRSAKDEEPSERRLPDFASYRGTLTLPPIQWRPLKRRTRLSIVPLNGIIAEGEGGRAPVGPEIAGSDGVAGAIRAARRDRRTSAILLYVNSPGGSAIASELILDEVRRAAKKKPVVAYFDRVAASGGYMAALGAEEIWAGPDAIAGSIGVFGGKFELSRLFERLGVRRTLITRGENAGLFSVSRPFTEHERKALESEIEEAYQDFLEQVSRSRGQSKDEVHARAQGRIYSGDEALQAGLVDRTGSFEDACRRALELAEKPTDRFDVAVHPAGKRRIPIVRLMREAQTTGVFALWLPGLELLEWEERR